HSLARCYARPSRSARQDAGRGGGRRLQNLRPRSQNHALLSVPLDGAAVARPEARDSARRERCPLRKLPWAWQPARRRHPPGRVQPREETDRQSAPAVRRRTQQLLWRLSPPASPFRRGDQLERSLERASPAALSGPERVLRQEPGEAL